VTSLPPTRPHLLKVPPCPNPIRLVTKPPTRGPLSSVGDPNFSCKGGGLLSLSPWGKHSVLDSGGFRMEWLRELGVGARDLGSNPGFLHM
jgi:hypothetical protein